MRDYSFGNFISALRGRCGLSQYQLGALVGVSDKAVSKWENGASIPRIGTIKKLAEVLDVSVDELLTCEYAAFDRERKDLFTMKKEIIKMARKRMHELYGENPPLRIVNRFKTEELMLKDHEMLLWMGFFGKLQREFCEKDLYFGIRDAQMGASFIAWLLGGTNVNPLPAHYYCPVCKNIEFVKDANNGIDLPDKKCSCGEEYKRDGFEVSEMNIYPLDKYNEIYISENATDHVKRCLQEYFDGYGVVRELNIIDDRRKYPVRFDRPLKMTRFELCSNDMFKKSYPNEIIEMSIDDYHNMINSHSLLMTIENPDEKMNAKEVMELDIKEKHINAFFRYSVETGRFKREYLDFSLEKIYSSIEKAKFSDLLSIYGFLHGTDVWKNNGEFLFDEGIPINELIYCREDLYAFIYDKLKNKCCENPSGIAFEIKENARKGVYARKMPIEIEDLLLECDVPEWYVESMKKIRYMFPKTHMIINLKHDICEFIKYEKGTI